MRCGKPVSPVALFLNIAIVRSPYGGSASGTSRTSARVSVGSGV